MMLGSSQAFSQVNDTVLKSFAPFPYGAAVSISLLINNAAYRALVAQQHSSVTCEGCMKMYDLQPSQGTYDWAGGDTLVKFAQQYNKRVHGHTLVWHGALPSWVTSFDGDSTALENILKTHIQTVVSHYAGQVTSWDVVNEAFNDDGTLRSTIWLNNLGSGYIARAFTYAHQADPNALLFYNDYGQDYSTAKNAAIKRMLDTFIANGVPIHGVGLQCHLACFSNLNILEASLDSMVATGLKVHISELDIGMNVTGSSSFTMDSVFNAWQFAQYKVVARQAKAINPSQMYGITNWDLTDGDSWIPWAYGHPDYPLPFTAAYKRKPAFQGLKDGMTRSWPFTNANSQILAGTYTDLGSLGKVIDTNSRDSAMTFDNDNSKYQQIGFPFVYNGSTYTTFTLNTNGFIKLGAKEALSGNIFITTATGTNGTVTASGEGDVIYPFNCDLKAGSGTPEYRVYTSGTAPNRVCTIQFKNLADKIAPVQYSNIRFQIKLYEGTNRIQFVYGSWVASGNASSQKNAAVGIKGVRVKESVNLVKGSSVSWSATPLSIANNIYFKAATGNMVSTVPIFGNSKSAMPPSGLTIQFDPVVVPLPLRLLSFTGEATGAGNVLDWELEDGQELAFCVLERSGDAVSFTALSGNTLTGSSSCSYTDRQPLTGSNYYRLRMTSKDNLVEYSNIVRLNTAAASAVCTLSPNPTDNTVELRSSAPLAAGYHYELCSMDGRCPLTGRLTAGSQVSALDVSRLSSGLYILNIYDGRNGLIQALPVLKK